MTASSGTLLPIAWLPRGARIHWTSPDLLGLTDATSKRSVGSTGDPSGDSARGAIIHARTSTTTATPLQLRVIALNLKAELSIRKLAISNWESVPMAHRLPLPRGGP